MPLLSSRRDQRRSDSGLTQELQTLGDEVAQLTVEHAKTVAQATGAPWGSRHLTTAEALQHTNLYDDPAKVEKVKQWTDAQLVRATLDAIRLRKAAQPPWALPDTPSPSGAPPGAGPASLLGLRA